MFIRLLEQQLGQQQQHHEQQELHHDNDPVSDSLLSLPPYPNRPCAPPPPSEVPAIQPFPASVDSDLSPPFTPTAAPFVEIKRLAPPTLSFASSTCCSP